MVFCDCSYQTRLGSSLSLPTVLLSGVVESDTGVLDRIGVKVKLFADDVKVYVPIVYSHDADNALASLTTCV